MARERWEDVIAYYKTYINIIQPLLKETRRMILSLEPQQLTDHQVFLDILQQESKRKVTTVKAISEFNAFFRKEIFRYILNYIDEVKEEFEVLDIRDYLIDFLDEANKCFDVLNQLAEEDRNKQESSLLFHLNQIISNLIFPSGKNLQDIYDQLIENSINWYELQRYIIQPASFYREEIGEMEIPGLSPKQYQIINQMTSLFNLDPNFMDLESNPDYVIPTIMKTDIFEPFIDNIANSESESLKRICSRMELQVIMDLFIGPTEKFLELTEPHKYIVQKEDSDGKTRWLPQLSNETLILFYLAKISFRRGFLSKELINWIAINFAFIIYNAILHSVMSDDNIFYNLFLDLKTEEKILPYLMKLLCFDKYLRLDRTKIRDSPTYRKEIFSFLGRKIEVIDEITYFLVEDLKKILNIDS
ncbi:MAG: hypothetical protein ACTSWL_06830 [Promethearchaeota archaeon]